MASTTMTRDRRDELELEQGEPEEPLQGRAREVAAPDRLQAAERAREPAAPRLVPEEPR